MVVCSISLLYARVRLFLIVFRARRKIGYVRSHSAESNKGDWLCCTIDNNGKKKKTRGATLGTPHGASSTPNDPIARLCPRQVVRRAALGDCTNGVNLPADPVAAAAGAGEGVAVGGDAANGASTRDDVGFMPNVVRGCSWSYEWKAVEAFLKENLFRGILRAHSVQVRWVGLRGLREVF